VHPGDGLVVAQGAGRYLVSHNVAKPALEEFCDLDLPIVDEGTIVYFPTQLLQFPHHLGTFFRAT
jgi:hypothetical protein